MEEEGSCAYGASSYEDAPRTSGRCVQTADRGPIFATQSRILDLYPLFEHIYLRSVGHLRMRTRHMRMIPLLPLRNVNLEFFLLKFRHLAKFEPEKSRTGAIHHYNTARLVFVDKTDEL